MARAVLQSTIQTANGTVSVAGGASVEVRDTDNNLITLYSARSGGTTVANPVTADTDGFFRVYLDPQRVTIIATAGGSSRTWSDVVLLDDVTPDLTQTQIDKRTIYAGSVAELEGLSLAAGTSARLTEDGRAGVGVVKTGTPPSDPRKGVFIVLANGNYWQRQFGQNVMVIPSVQVNWFGVDAADAYPAFSAAKDFLAGVYAGQNYRTVKIPNGQYKLSQTVTHETDDDLASFPVNGCVFEGASLAGVVIEPTSGFAADTPLFSFNGNPTSQTVTPKSQTFSGLENMTLKCGGICRGFELRGVAYSDFSTIYISGSTGSSTTGAITFRGATGTSEDDIDTSYNNRFQKVRIRGGTGYGVLARENMVGQTLFESCDIRDCDLDGMRMAFASLKLDNTTLASNGSTTSTGGFSAIKPLTGAINRGLVLDNCQMEANWSHELSINNTLGYEINSGIYTPFAHLLTGQSVFKLGVSAAGFELTEGGKFSGVRIAEYSAPSGEVIKAFEVGSRVRGLDVKNTSFGEGSTTNWATQDRLYDISPLASDIKIDGRQVSKFSEAVYFQNTLTQSATAIANVTGDGTAYTTQDANAASTSFANDNTGPQKSVVIVTAECSGTTLTISSVTGTPIRVGNRIRHPNFHPNTYIVARGTGSGGTGTYEVNISQTVASTTGVAVWRSQWFDVQTGLFEAPASGLYKFYSRWPLTDFSSTETSVEVAVTKNPGGASPEKRVVKSIPISGLSASDLYYADGEATIRLAKGDTVNASVVVSGGTKVVDLSRNDPTGYLFVGEAL